MIINFNFFNTKFSAQNTTKRNIKSGNADNQPNIYFHAHKNLRSPQKKTPSRCNQVHLPYIYTAIFITTTKIYI